MKTLTLWDTNYHFRRLSHISILYRPCKPDIRNALTGKQEYPVSVLNINLDNEKAVKELSTGLSFIKKPEIHQSMIVTIKLTDKVSKYTYIKTVLIQNPTDTGVDDMIRVGNVLKTHLSDVDVVPLKNFREMENPNPYFDMWVSLVKEFNIKKG